MTTAVDWDVIQTNKLKSIIVPCYFSIVMSSAKFSCCNPMLLESCFARNDKNHRCPVNKQTEIVLTFSPRPIGTPDEWSKRRSGVSTVRPAFRLDAVFLLLS